MLGYWDMADQSAEGPLAAKWGSTSMSDSEREDREDERLVRQSPKKKPPRRDLERGRVKDRDNSESDPDERQDKKDRSQNYKDSSLIMKWGKLLYAEEVERRDGDTWKTESGKWSGKFDGKTQIFETEEAAKEYADGKPKDGDEEGGSGEDKEDKKTLSESLLGGFSGVTSDDPTEKEKAIKDLSENVAANVSDFVDGSTEIDQEATEEITKLLSDNLDQDTMDVLVSEAKDRTIGKENSSNPDYELTDREKVDLEKEFERGFVEEFKKQIKSIVDDSNKRETKRKEEEKTKRKEEDDNRIISDLEGEEARQMEVHMFEVTRNSLENYRKVEDKGERKRAMEELEDQIKEFPEGSKRRMELESERRGILVSNILVDGPDAEGVGPSMSILIQAAEKTGNLDAFLGLNLLGGENTAESQQAFRNVLKDVGVHNLTDFMTEDNPARKAVEVLQDPGFLSRSSPESKQELEEMIIDSIVSGVIFADAELEREMPNSTVGKKNKAKKKSPQNENIWEKIKQMLEKLSNSSKLGYHIPR